MGIQKSVVLMHTIHNNLDLEYDSNTLILESHKQVCELAMVLVRVFGSFCHYNNNMKGQNAKRSIPIKNVGNVLKCITHPLRK